MLFYLWHNFVFRYQRAFMATFAMVSCGLLGFGIPLTLLGLAGFQVAQLSYGA